jgi:hypothetical protein
MKKMPCLLVRRFTGPNSFELTDQVTPGCEWVLNGEGTASRKWDGTSCAVIKGNLFKRYDAKRKPDGTYKAAPEGAIPCGEPDSVTGHHPHWVRCLFNNAPDQYHMQAWWEMLRVLQFRKPADGTYELIGPPIGANAENVDYVMLKRHGDTVLEVPRTIEGITHFLNTNMMEGIVFAHHDGRMCKIRRNDFGLPWGKAKAKQ